MDEFNLDGRDYIELNKLLKIKKLVSTGGEAHMMIDDGQVIVNDVVEKRRRNKLRAGDIVSFGDHRITVK